MKKFCEKVVLPFAAAMALCAFAMPSMVSASSWGPILSEHTLDGTLGFINDPNAVTSDCAATQFTATVVSAAVIEITGASIKSCTWAGASGGPLGGKCAVTSTGTGFPWTATAVTTSDIQIHGVDIDFTLAHQPGDATCNPNGLDVRITGTLRGGRWTGNATHEIDLPSGPTGASGLVGHTVLGNNLPFTLTGTIVDTQQTLTVTN